jgi:hypothetical protein
MDMRQMNNRSKLQKQSASAITGLDEITRSIKTSQTIYKESSTVYPPRLDDMISEFCRDARCCRRRWELLSARLDSQIEASECEQIIDDFRDIRQLYIQVIEKLDDILFEFQGIDDVDRALFGDSEFLDAFGEQDDDAEEGDIYYDG